MNAHPGAVVETSHNDHADRDPIAARWTVGTVAAGCPEHPGPWASPWTPDTFRDLEWDAELHTAGGYHSCPACGAALPFGGHWQHVSDLVSLETATLRSRRGPDETVVVIEAHQRPVIHVGDTVNTRGSYGTREGVVVYERDEHGAVWAREDDGSRVHAWAENVRLAACPHDPENETFAVTVRHDDGREVVVDPDRLSRRLDPAPPGPPPAGRQPDIFELLGGVA